MGVGMDQNKYMDIIFFFGTNKTIIELKKAWRRDLRNRARWMYRGGIFV
jgi:hypothetical protein